MTKRFGELAERAKAAWSPDAHVVYAAAGSAFAEDVSERIMLGSSIAAARRERELSQTALAELTGIQQGEISRIERGLGNPTAATLLRLADALGQRLTMVPLQR